ncbi:hypothetical protein LRP31_34440 (plasmid) [Mesorhizobium mediterraneum]|nr:MULTISPECIES: hypothetical protein [Mesorhizobium]WIW57195.1 hypothetical protein LRP31_34440 [Mesorhizobium mediterraneum]
MIASKIVTIRSPVLLHGGDDHVVRAPFRELTLSTLREIGAHLRGARVRD